MSTLMSSATTLPPSYYQSFAPSSRAMAADASPPDEKETAARAEEQILEEARQQTYDLQSLAAGWNGYDALPPAAPSIRQAMHWLVRSYAECKDAGVRWYKPNVTASAEGEVVFEWRASDRSLIIYVEGDGVTFHKSWDVAAKTQHQHGDAPFGAAQAKLLRWFGE
jgi:hypothetical protein